MKGLKYAQEMQVLDVEIMLPKIEVLSVEISYKAYVLNLQVGNNFNNLC